MRNLPEVIAGVLFGVGALIHLGRVLCPFEVNIGEFHFPMWASAVTFVLAGLLSAWLFRSRREV
ncbi:MAG: hypothetical protein H0U49_12355 [Parachlamydiaceae bacterium]|nr:hypothetical protein [Parachlamydiaceae bacterium]